MRLAILHIVVPNNLTGLESDDPSDFERPGGFRKVARYFRMLPEGRPPTRDHTPQPPLTSTTSTTRLELQEADLVALLRAGKAGVWSGPERKKAQEFADRLDIVRFSENGYTRSSDRCSRLLTIKTSSSQK